MRRRSAAKYFHNNAWATRGPAAGRTVRAPESFADDAGDATVRKPRRRWPRHAAAIRSTWPADPADWWLPRRSSRVPTGLRDGHGEVPPTRTTATGRSCSPAASCRRKWRTVWSRQGFRAGGILRHDPHRSYLDDWPLADYLYGLWALGRKNDFLLSLYGHVAYHQAEGHLTAYESVTFPPGQENTPYCLPCQLVAARAARLLVR